ncbi:MAG TPA: cyclase family protein [Streptosporangiaceae bacterium]|nr:cyclase family protein [Streptosporangiaceae bacterium]
MSDSAAAQLGLLETLSNWGRWGPDDELGTLNFITPEVRRAALAVTRSGRSVSCARELRPDVMPYAAGASAVQRYMVRSGEGYPADVPAAAASEYLGLVFHGRLHTHLDSLAHVFAGGRLYNGAPAGQVSTAAGAARHAVTAVADGILARGVLIDAARHRGVAWLPEGARVEPDEVVAIAAAQAVELRPGDALLLRTGHGAQVAAWQRGDPPITGYAGWAASCLPWFRDRQVSLIGADTAQDPVPPAPGALVSPIHVAGIVGMGLWLLDNCNLEGVSRAAAEAERWEFLLVIGALRLAGGTGSPVNPIAVF